MQCTHRDKNGKRSQCLQSSDRSADEYNEIQQMQQSQIISLEMNLSTMASKMDQAYLVVDRIEKISAQIYACVKDGRGQDGGLKELTECVRSKMDPLAATLGDIQTQNASLLAGMAGARVENVITQQQKITYEPFAVQKPMSQELLTPPAHVTPNGLNGGHLNSEGLESVRAALQDCVNGTLKTALKEHEDRLALQIQALLKSDSMTPRLAGGPFAKPEPPRLIEKPLPPSRVGEQNKDSQKLLIENAANGGLKRASTFRPWACTVCKNVNYSDHSACSECGGANPTSDKEIQAANDEHNIKLMEDNSFAAVFANECNPAKPVYRVEDCYKTTGMAQAIARNNTFHTVTVALVLINALWIGLETDINTQPNIYNSSPFVFFIAMFFCSFFVFEWLVRTLAFKHLRDAFKDGWYRFDTFLVITMVADYWILNVIMKIMEDESGSKKKMPIPTAPLRTLRLLKLTRMARLMRAFPELVTMVKGLVRSLRATATTIMMLVLMDYVFAIVLHLLLKEKEEINRSTYEETKLDFTSLWKAMWLLAMNGTFMLDGTSPMLTQMLFSGDFIAVLGCLLICTYLCFSAILILNMLIGVLTELVGKVNEEQRHAQAVSLVRQELLAKLNEYDDGDGNISHSELMVIMNDSKARAVIKHLGINELFMLQQIEMLYRTSENVSIGAALNLMLTCRSQNVTTIETIAGGFSFMAKQVDSLRSAMVKMEKNRQSEIDARIEDLKLSVAGAH